MKYFMTIAASDNSGGAGIQQDLKVVDRLGFWGLSVITGITVQDFSGLDTIYQLPLDLIKAQFIKNISSFPVDVIKIGALCSPEITLLITQLLREHYKGLVVVDPVLAPTKGQAFISQADIAVYNKLLEQASIVTPNKGELELLTGGKITDYADAIRLAQDFVKKTNCSLYIKGGHLASPESSEIREYLITANSEKLITKEKQVFQYSHGTGCFFASALACYLGEGNDMFKACQMATEEVTKFYVACNIKLTINN